MSNNIILYFIIFIFNYYIKKIKINYRWLVDLPKILDIIAIYGENNTEIIKNIVAEAFKLNREYY